MGRPAVGPQHPVRCTREEWAAVEQVAAIANTDRSAMARRLIILGLERLAEQTSPGLKDGRS